MGRAILVACFAFVIMLVTWSESDAGRMEPSSATSRQASVGLTPQGRLLWNLEGLLRKSFPGRQVVSVTGGPGRRSSFFDFSCPGLCAPAADYSTYRYVFTPHGGSAFHLSSRKFNEGYFGVYPVQLLVRGRSIACNKNEMQFLIAYRNTLPLTLACAPVGPR